MHLKKLLSIIALIHLCNGWSQQYFPGGVAGAEVWYKVDYISLAQGSYPNSGEPFIKLTSCTPNIGGQALFNFNHSIKTSGLCLTYNAPLESMTARNVFFVGEPQELTVNYSHLTTNWRADMSGIILPAWLHRYRFDLANKGAYVNDNITPLFNSVTKANVNFYNWNLYQTDKRFKTSGLYGETSFYIGKNFANSTVTPIFQGQAFAGNFPEFISYPFELTANQKNRVESYLALKYGITLASGTPYRNAKNTVFWNSANYVKFGNRVFGIGRDDISGLNQLQSESVHNKDYLIASVETLMPTNPEKQQMVQIGNNNFIVFGDNGLADGLETENAQNVRVLKRKWLSQNTDEHAKSINMFFKLNLMTAINQAMAADPHLKLWMLHDRYVTNQAVSDFTSQYVEYYDAAAMDALQYGFFKDVHFDTDSGIYDQFTFGVGPEMIVQIRFKPGDCDDNIIESSVVITGGKAPYKVNLQNTNGYNADFTITDNILPFQAIAPDTYTAYVIDDAGNEAEVVVDVVPQQVLVNLGPNIVFNASLQQAILNAGANVLDPTATYQWKKDGILLEHYSPTLTVTEPGEYTVIVTSGNMMCQETDSVLVGYNFPGSAYAVIGCEDEFGSIVVNTSGGVPNFTTVVSGSTLTVSQVHSTTNHTIPNLPPDNYIVTTTDNVGNVFQTNVEIPDMLGGIELDLENQLVQQSPNCISWVYSDPAIPGFFCGQPFVLDASLLVTNPYVSYEWFLNGISQGIYSPVVTLTNYPMSPADPNGFNEFQVVITNLETDCSVTETVAVARFYGIEESGSGNITSNTSQKEETDSITARVYPNPSDAGATFYYEITASYVFDGTVTIHSPTGAVLYETNINGKSNYKIPFSLITSGTYLAITRTGEKTLTNQIIIR